MSATELVRVVHPDTGELLERLDTQPPETLADTLAAVRARQAELKSMNAALEQELRRRMELRGRSLTVFGDYEVCVEGSNESVWDAEELETTLRALVDDGVLVAGELTGIIRREPQVSRAEANKLLGRLSGQAKAAVERCRTWQRKGHGRVRVTRSVQLPDPQSDPQELPW